MPSARTRTPFFSTLALVSVLGGAACNKPSEAPPPAAPPAVEVGTLTVQPSSIPMLDELPGRIAPMRSAEVRPRVSGIIVERVFRQGGSVKAGDVLFKLDASMYEVERASAKAVLARAEVTASEALQQAQRGEKLLADGVVTQEQHETLQAALRRAEADVAAARAALRRAELNLEYTTIRAPIGGRIGRALVTEGALVSAGDPTALALIQQLDPVYVDFTQPAMELRRLRQALKDGHVQGGSSEQANIQLVLDDGALYEKAGRLLFSDVSVDPGSGQVTLRGEFPNPDAELLPGMYVRGRVEQGTLSEALVVPQQAIQRDNTGKSQVFVVAGNGTAEVRPVRVSRTYQEQAVIQEGLKAGEQVIVEGFQKIGAGSPVKPVAWTTTGAGIQPSQPR
ncbi:efflux RND transporter periplasmic adaptor subunit [Archangium violaceum]|uniref:efflux RND transporter periplasmic adaptor subunit n=1 Tax=Archangium violaceum TaxID=83451 RepID=UPI0036D91F0F